MPPSLKFSTPSMLRETQNLTSKLRSHLPLTLSTSDVCSSLCRVNVCKAAGIPVQAIRACADQLAGVFTDIFSLALAQAGPHLLQKCDNFASAQTCHHP